MRTVALAIALQFASQSAAFCGPLRAPLTCVTMGDPAGQLESFNFDNRLPSIGTASKETEREIAWAVEWATGAAPELAPSCEGAQTSIVFHEFYSPTGVIRIVDGVTYTATEVIEMSFLIFRHGRGVASRVEDGFIYLRPEDMRALGLAPTNVDAQVYPTYVETRVRILLDLGTWLRSHPASLGAQE